MKFFKVTVFLFLIFSLLQCTSGNKKERIEVSNKPAIDSLGIYMQQMKDASLSNEQCLYYANKALTIEKNTRTNSKNLEKILEYKIYLLGSSQQLDSAIRTSKELLQLSILKNDSISIGRAYATMGYYYSQNFKKDSAYVLYNHSREIHVKLGDSVKIGENLAQMAIIQSDLGDFNGSDTAAIQALEYLDKNNELYLTAVYNCLAISSRKQHDFQEAIYWYDKAISISTNTLNTVTYLNNKANAYMDLKQYDISIDLLEGLLKNPLLNKDTRAKARIIDNLAFIKWLANKNVDVLEELLLAMNMRVQAHDIFGLIASYAHLSEYYKSKNSKIAHEYATKMYTQARDQKSSQDQLQALEKLIEFEASSKAKVYYARYVKLNDSLKEAEQKALNKFAKLKYDSEKNREDNLQLKITNAKKELELEKEKTTNIITGVSGSAIVLGLLIFGFYRKQKYQQEKRAEVYKTETRIAKKIHDEVANNVVNIMNKVQYTENSKEALLDDLEKVYALTRNISHQNNAIETGEKFEFLLKTMVTSFNSDTTTIILKDIHKAALAEIGKEKQIEIYRVLQELMVNMRNHSEASLVAITFRHHNHQYYINYSDNGIGVNLEGLDFKNGLNNVETRIKSIHGTITFETSLSNGFKAFISFKN